MTPRTRPQGWTIVELMVGLALVTLFAATAAPFAAATRQSAADAQARIDHLTALREGLAAFADDVRSAESVYCEGEMILILGGPEGVRWQRHPDGRVVRSTGSGSRCIARNSAGFAPSHGVGTVGLTWTLRARHGGPGPAVRGAFALGGSR